MRLIFLCYIWFSTCHIKIFPVMLCVHKSYNFYCTAAWVQSHVLIRSECASFFVSTIKYRISNKHTFCVGVKIFIESKTAKSLFLSTCRLCRYSSIYKDFHIKALDKHIYFEEVSNYHQIRLVNRNKLYWIIFDNHATFSL